ncbi:MAG: PD40 domain-containing protein [Flavobacteriia bacterium]|nr:PD40 domain-containing protein [Flavobacteriia bacterium]
MNLRLLITFVITAISLNVKAINNHLTPPDSTSKIIDQASSMLLVDEGRLLFDEGKIKDALNLFREAAAKDPYNWKPTYWISNCHYGLYNFGFALKYAKEAVKTDAENVDKDVYELIGRSFHQLGQLDSAIFYYNKSLGLLSKTRIKDLQINEKIEQCNFTKEQIALGKKSLRVKLVGDINTGFNEYAPILSHNGKIMYFTSRRNNTTGGKVNQDDQEFFEDIYRSEWNETEQRWDSVTNEIDRINSDGFDALSYITVNGLHAFMTLNTSMIESKHKTKSGEICEIEFTDKGKWSSPKIIKNKSINSPFGESGATLTADGNTMYFMSDRNHDKKLKEIYVVHKEGKNWGTAVALSDSINTNGDETTPFITPDGKYLFFSSNGHKGMGGLDIFVSENLGGDTWSKPINLGLIVNTVNDDTHFQYYPELKLAVMSGIEIIGQKSSRDIYEVDMSNFIFPKFF